MPDDLPLGLSILMGVYNEADRIEQALETTLAVELSRPFELIVVDDGSSDGTAEYLGTRELPGNVRLHFHERNQGTGAAVRTALADARMRWSASFDADLEYDPGDLRVLLETLMHNKEIDAVFGVRALAGYRSHSFLFVPGNKLVTLVGNTLFDVHLHDLTRPPSTACQRVRLRRWIIELRRRSRVATPGMLNASVRIASTAR